MGLFDKFLDVMKLNDDEDDYYDDDEFEDDEIVYKKNDRPFGLSSGGFGWIHTHIKIVSAKRKMFHHLAF